LAPCRDIEGGTSGRQVRMMQSMAPPPNTMFPAFKTR
jgi:hypothetical protein